MKSYECMRGRIDYVKSQANTVSYEVNEPYVVYSSSDVFIFRIKNKKQEKKNEKCN